MRVPLIFALFVFLLANGTAIAGDFRVHHYDKRPISLSLPIGERVQVFFDHDVIVAFPLNSSFIEIESVGKSVYLKARRTFPKTLMRIKEADSERHVLLDIDATDKAKSFSLKVVHVEDAEKAAAQAAQTSPGQKLSADPRVLLFRHASQSLYPYSGRQPTNQAIRAMTIQQAEATRFINDVPVKAEVIKAWKGYGFYVTAVKLTNMSQQSIVLDPRRNIRGLWTAIAFQHPRLVSAANGIGQETTRPTTGTELAPVFDKRSVTTAYVISQQPFWEAQAL